MSAALMIEPVDLALRASGLLALAASILWLFRAHAASTRHLLWTLTFLLLLTLPAAMLTLPSLEWVAWPFSAPIEATSAVHPEATGASLGAVLTMLWLTGTLVLWLSLAAGWIRFARWARTGRPCRDADWIAIVEELRTSLGIRRPIRLILSARTTVPMTGGVIFPVVLLPESADNWPASRRVAVLSHELIHIRRHDALRQMLTGLAVAIYWFHPLSWWAARQAVLSREQACDEGVLELGAKPSDYASHLFALAGYGQAPRLAAMPLIQRSQLERRIQAILSPDRPSTSWSLASMLCFVLILGALTSAVLAPPQGYSCEYKNPLPERLLGSP